MAIDYWSRFLSRRVSRRRALAASGSTALGAGLLAACGGGDDSGPALADARSAREPGKVWPSKNDWTLADETKDAVRGGIYRGHSTADRLGHYDAISIFDHLAPAATHVYEMYFGRTRRPGVKPGTKEAETPTPALAESWEFSNDGATVTFTMRQGVKWQPVAPVNSRVMDMDDWRTSQERHLAVGAYRLVLGDILDKTEYPDARHLVWKFKQPYAPILTRIHGVRFTNVVLPKELNANPSLAESVSVGTGFKILDKHQPAVTMEYRKNPEYWGGDPFIERWHEPIIPEYANRYSQFLAGNITDFTPTPRDVLSLHRDAPQAVVVAEALRDDWASRYRFGRINAEKQAWADPRVRVAIERSIDHKSISEFLSNKAQFEAAGIPIDMLPMTHVGQNPSFWLNPEKGELGALSENYLYSVAEAKKLTSAAGYTDAIPIPYAIVTSQGEFTEIDQLTLDSFRASGTFNPQIIRIPPAEIERYRLQTQFEGIMGSSIGAAADADHYLGQEYHSTISRPKAYSDPKIDSLVEAQRRAFDLEERWRIIKEIQLVLAQFMPVIPPRHEYTTFRFRWPWLHNVNWGETGSPPAGRDYWGGHLQWLDPGMPDRDKRV